MHSARPYALILALASSILLSACSNGAGSMGSSVNGPGASTATPSSVIDHSPTITVTPANQAAAVPLNAPLTVQAFDGTLDSVVVREAGHSDPVAGALETGSHLWRAADLLDPSATYTVDATATSPAGDATTARSTFTTTAANRLTTAVTPVDGDSVGIGMPIKLHFNADIPADHQLDVVNHVDVSSEPKTDGAWHWFAPNEVHWRPRNYWATGTKVTVVASFKGLDAGGGSWGLGDWSDNFTVGDAHVSSIDGAAHTMTVTSNGQPLYTWPVSLGRPRNPTIGGTLVVWYKQQDVLMDSMSIGIPRTSPDGYYEHVYDDVAISTDGFFIHSAPWSVSSQGRENVSHGCVNLSPDRARTFFAFSRPGDVVVAANTGRVADSGDGEGDWQIPFAEFANSGGQVPVVASNPGGA